MLRAACLDAIEDLSRRAVAEARRLTDDGKRLDDEQVLVEALAHAVTEAKVAQALHAEAMTDEGLAQLADAAALEALDAMRARLERVADRMDLAKVLAVAQSAAARARGQFGEPLLRAIGRRCADATGDLRWPDDPTQAEVRKSVRQFAEREVAPHAEHIHQHDTLIPERIIAEMGRLGYFGLAIPEAFGGFALGNRAMIVTTEELSRASLAAAGSLITRPEILAKALLAGGTEAQKAAWLPALAAGERMAAISVTEPNVGSDVASITCRAVQVEGGWEITGAKAWCTFAGRADVIAVLARTEPDLALGAKGLSLFVVEKPRFDGHAFEHRQATGGTLTGKADRTPGYRGMHSFTLAFDRFRVPVDALIGGDAGRGKGFYLQMAGFAAGRLQTGGRACGVMQAALDVTSRYVVERSQFGRPLIEYPLTQYHLGRMAVQLAGARALTYAAADAMDFDERSAATVAAQAKLYACDAAVAVTQAGQVLHGGWGYAEEYPISRYVIDAQVLPIFEGVRPVLALKVIGRALLAGER